MEWKSIAFLSMQIFTVPLVVACAVGIVIGLARSELGSRARLGVIGFGLLLVTQLLSVLQNYLMVYEFPSMDVTEMGKLSAKFGVLRLALELAGLITLIVAVFQRPKPSAT